MSTAPADHEQYFLPYQSAWIRDPARLKLCQKGRQIGLSFADSYDSVRKAAVLGGRDVWVMSRDEAQAKQYIRYCKHWAKVLSLAAQDYGEQVLNTHSRKPMAVQALSFASRATIYALSSNPDAIVGKSGHVKLDEFALHREQRTLYAVAKPVIQWGGTLSILSTHRGVGTVFNEIIQDIVERGNRMNWSLHTLSIQTAVEQGLVERIDGCRRRREESLTKSESSAQEPANGDSSRRLPSPGETELLARRQQWLQQQRSECIDEEQWLQEYCCIPADESAAFITYEMLNQCQEPALQLVSIDSLENQSLDGRSLYLGVDVARKHDLCVFDLGELRGDVVWDVARLELRNKTFAEIRSELYQLLQLPALKRCCIDATGLGMQLAEEAKDKFAWKVEPVLFSAGTKQELAFALRHDFESCKLRIAGDDKLEADLRGVKKEVTVAGNIRFASESADSHCDRFWAKALRQHAIQNQPKSFGIVC